MSDKTKEQGIDEQLREWEGRNKREFWLVARGITGQRIEAIKDIPEEDKKLIIEVFKLNYGTETGKTAVRRGDK